MSRRLAQHLLFRLRHVARLRAVESAIEAGILAVPDDGPSSGRKGKGRRIRRPDPEHEEDRFRRTFDFDTQNKQPPSHVVVGPVLEGRSPHQVASILARRGIALTADDRNAGARPSVTQIWNGVRRQAPPPHADEIAVTLLLAAAIERSGLSDKDWRRLLRRRDWTATILSPVDGFELRSVRMMREGAFGRVFGVYDGNELRANMTALPSRYERARSLIVFWGKDDDSYVTAESEEQVGFAARLGVPVLGIADGRRELPSRLRKAACLSLDTGPLTSAIVCYVLHEVLGAASDNAARQLTDALCAALSLHDLAAAIRPERDVDEVVETLIRLSGASGGYGSDAVRGKTGAAASGGRSGSDWGKRGNSNKVTSGSEIIEPVVPAVAAPSASSDQQSSAQPLVRQTAVPVVETLHGYGAAKEWALDLKQDLALWRSGSLPWAQMSTKLLLSGPPGTGKTTFARALCNTLQVPLLANSVSTWLEPGHLGDVIKRIRISFEEAQTHAPAILFVDEIDGIGRRGRNSEYDDYWSGIVNKLLELLDGSNKTEGLIIVGATNHPGVIDPALLRSGRLETRIQIPLPDVDALIGILAHHLGNDFPGVIATRPQIPTMAEDRVAMDATAMTNAGRGPGAGDTPQAVDGAVQIMGGVQC